MKLKLIITLLALCAGLSACAVPTSAVVQAHALNSSAMRAMGATTQQQNAFWK